MVKRDDINSTQRLLELIRRNEHKGVQDKQRGFSDESSHAPPPRKEGLVFKRLFKKHETVGIDFGYRDIHLIKIHKYSPQQWKLIDYLKVPFDSKLSWDSFELSKFVRQVLTSFCGTIKKYDLWGMISSSRLEMRYILIPKVSKRQISNAVYWTIKKKIPFDEEENIFDYEILGDVSDQGMKKTAVIAYIYPKPDVTELKKLFSRCGYPLTGITLAPFAIQNLLRTNIINSSEKTLSCIYIRRNHSRIDVFSEGNLMLTRAR